MRNIELRMAELKAELWNILVMIASRRDDIEKLQAKADRLDARILQLRDLAATMNDLYLDELVRMCNTPCHRYVPRLPMAVGAWRLREFAE